MHSSDEHADRLSVFYLYGSIEVASFKSDEKQHVRFV